MLPNNLSQQKFFSFFEQLSAIPRGSGNMNAVAQFCQDFAQKHGLKCIRDSANNIVIFKDGTKGYESAAPVILQGHLDMVCQKTDDCNINFEKDGLDIYADGDFIKAHGTTLGADNGIAVAMILAVLDSDSIPHPPIEAVFTTDEEVGMIGARALDMSVLCGKRMINLDSEKDDNVTVSCAGGSDFKINVPLERTTKHGTQIKIELGGLLGGHSGDKIDKNRVNANMLAGRILNEIGSALPFDIISINGGDKANAIPNRCVIELCTGDPEGILDTLQNIYSVINAEICDREPTFKLDITIGDTSEYQVFGKDTKNKIIYTLLCAPNGIMEMSAEIAGLVQTSLNLGILMTNCDSAVMHFALRSNKKSALLFLEQRLMAFFNNLNLKYETFGHYPPWEYKSDSPLRELYCSVCSDVYGTTPTVSAIHAGLECGVFADGIKGLDCISVGPTLYDIHTTRERLSISSAQKFYCIFLNVLEKLNP